MVLGRPDGATKGKNSLSVLEGFQFVEVLPRAQPTAACCGASPAAP